MKVYHGSTYVVEMPNLNVANYKSDFGKGFYTTKNIEQAKKWTRIKRNRMQREGIDDIKQYVNVYEYIPNSRLQVLDFQDATDEWLEFILKNRKSEKLSHEYDIVIGPVANDNLYQVLVGYENGIYDKSETIKRLKTYLLANQVSFHTEEALKCLKYIETFEVKD